MSLSQNYLNVGIGNTWFEIANQYDLNCRYRRAGQKSRMQNFMLHLGMKT